MLYEYKFGFNGHEKNDEIYGEGNQIAWGDYGMDARLGRRWNIDPQWERIPGQSPYSVNNNNPISYTDPDGEFGWLGALIGAGVGAAVELTSQVVSNVVAGKPVFEKIDWADVVIATAEGATIRATGGISLLASSGFEAAKASIDYTKEEGFSDVLSLTSDKRKDIGRAGIDFTGGLLGLGAGKLLPSEKIVGDFVADQFVKNGIKSEAQFLTGMITSDLVGGIVGGVQSGVIEGFYKRGIDQLFPNLGQGTSSNPSSENGAYSGAYYGGTLNTITINAKQTSSGIEITDSPKQIKDKFKKANPKLKYKDN